MSPYNLEPRKNLMALLRAVALLQGDYPGLQLVLFGKRAGDPAREANFERQVDERNLRSVVHLVGFVPDDQLAWLYRQATVFVFPSLYEGFGLPVLEAMAAGACVVVRNRSAMAEVVGEGGCLLETACPEQLAAGLAGLLEDRRERRRLAAAARERAALFSVHRMAERTFASYCKALGLGGPSRHRSRS